jgi:hypothetical protein
MYKSSNPYPLTDSSKDANMLKIQKKSLPVQNQVVNKDASADTLKDTDAHKIQENILGVPTQAIRKDASGKYYLFIVDRGSFNADMNIRAEEVFKVKRIDIIPGNIKRNFLLNSNSEIELTSIKDSGELKLGDIIIVNSSDGIKDGEKAQYVEKKWLFYPGDRVKIRIPSLSSQGFYVPPEAIVSVDEDENYVYIIQNDNTVKLVKINITGYSKGYYAIASPNLHENDKVAFVNRVDLYEKLYDGAEIIPGEVFDPSLYLKQRSVKRKYELGEDAQESDGIAVGVKVNKGKKKSGSTKKGEIAEPWNIGVE